ncbi:MAG: hypothetical protein ACRDRS_19660 [Pseudonocardiaceae bacterium]
MPTAPIPREQDRPQLSARTLAYLAERPPIARTLVHRVWSTLTKLQRSGRHPNPSALAALLAQLLEHQPSRTGRCHVCPRRHSWHPWWSWQRRWQHPHFPCPVWTTTDFQLQRPFHSTRPHARESPSSPPQGRTADRVVLPAG